MKVLGAISACVIVLATTDAFAQKAGGPTKVTTVPLTVVDAAGRAVGRLNAQSVFATVGGVPTWLQLTSFNSDTLQTETDPTRVYFSYDVLRFSSSDCTGTVYGTQSYGLGALSGTFARTGGGQLMLYVQSGEASLLTLRSLYNNGACTATQDQLNFAYPLAAPIDVSTLYTLPLSVR